MILKIRNPAFVSLLLRKINRIQPKPTFCANAEFSIIGSFLFVAQMTNLTISKCISTIFATWTNQATCQPIKLTLPSCIYAPRSNRPFSDGVFVIAQGQLQWSDLYLIRIRVMIMMVNVTDGLLNLTKSYLKVIFWPFAIIFYWWSGRSHFKQSHIWKF